MEFMESIKKATSVKIDTVSTVYKKGTENKHRRCQMSKDLNEVLDVSLSEELTDQERQEHDFIGEVLEDEEIMSVAFACEKGEDVIPSQFYFATKKKEGVPEVFSLLAEAVENKLRIKGMKRGAPLFDFKS